VAELVKGKFTVTSGRLVEQYDQRTYDYDVVQWIKRDEYTPHNQKLRTYINAGKLHEAEAIYVKIDMPDGSEQYRYLWGPFFSGQAEIEQHLTDVFTYGSP